MSRRRTILLFVAFPGLLTVIVAALLIPNLSASLVHAGEIQIQPLSSSTQANLEIKPVDPKPWEPSLWSPKFDETMDRTRASPGARQQCRARCRAGADRADRGGYRANCGPLSACLQGGYRGLEGQGMT